MARIALLSCTKAKKPYKCAAREMYSPSPWFPTAYQFVKYFGAEQVFILSPLYGLLHEDTVIEPYEATLDTFSSQEISEWAAGIIDDLRQVTDLDNDHFIIIAGKKYYQNLLPHIRHAHLPVRGLGLNLWVPKLKQIMSEHNQKIKSTQPKSTSIQKHELELSPDVKAFETTIQALIEQARADGKPYVDIVSGQVHRLVGGYPGQNHKMPTCCKVMYRLMKPGDEVLAKPTKGLGASVKIRYYL